MWFCILCSAALIAADQSLKALARAGKLPIRSLGGLVEWTHVENPGLAAGRCRDNELMTKALPSCAMLLSMVMFLPRLRRSNAAERAGIAMLLSGGISNLLDRLLRGSVTDYICLPKLPLQRLRILVWNLADSCLLLGAIVFTVGRLFRRLAGKQATE
jgi:signal peptidase II